MNLEVLCLAFLVDRVLLQAVLKVHFYICSMRILLAYELDAFAGYFVLEELGLCALAVLVSIVIMFAHQRAFAHQWLIPKWLPKILLCSSSKVDAKSVTVNEIDTIIIKQKSKLREVNSFASLSSTLQKVNEWIDEERREKMIMQQWNYIFDRIDLVFLILFQIVHATVMAILVA